MSAVPAVPRRAPARIRFRGIAAVVLAATVTSLSAGCDAAEPASPPPATSVAPVPTTAPIRVNTRALAPSMMPADVRDPATARVASLLFRGLVRYDAKGKAVPEVASSIQTSDDQTFTVTLEPGWTFTDGEPVTAKSFVDAWNFAARPAARQYRADAFAPILGYDAVRGSRGSRGGADELAGLSVQGPHSFTITLTQAQPGFPDVLGDPAFVPLPAVALRHPQAFAAAPVGNGPYQLDGSWNTTQLRLRPSSTYRGGDVAANAGLTLRVYPDLDAAYADLAAGKLDVLDDIPVDKLATYRTELGDRAVTQPVGLAQSLVVPLRRPEWRGAAGLARRTALSNAVDRAGMTGTLLAGTRAPATDLAAPVVEGSSQSLCGDLCRHDDAAAKAAATAAGGFTEPVRIAYAADSADRQWVEALCTHLRTSLAVTCLPQSYPNTPALQDAVRSGRETGLHVETWQMSRPALAAFLVPRFVGGAQQNTSGYTNDVVDTGLNTASTAPAGAQANAYQQIEATILAGVPVIPLWSVSATFAFAPGVNKVRSDVFGAPVYTEITRG